MTTRTIIFLIDHDADKFTVKAYPAMHIVYIYRQDIPLHDTIPGKELVTIPAKCETMNEAENIISLYCKMKKIR